MKVFVSWSGEASHAMAKALKDWLPNVIQAVDVFLSSEDIAKGSQWFAELGKELDESEFGILCLTRANLRAPWVLYEAGALGKRFGQARVVPLLLDLTMPELQGPLAHFNAAEADRDEIAKVVKAINAALGPDGLKETQLAKVLKTWWPDLEKALAQARKLAASGADDHDYDVFLSTPMAAFHTDTDYRKGRAEFKKVFDALKNTCGLTVYWASEKITCFADFDTVGVSALDDLEALKKSRRFVLLYPEKLPSSALFEAGYALARNCESHYFVQRQKDLPFLMQALTDADNRAHIHTDADWKDYDDLAKKVVKYKDKWFGD